MKIALALCALLFSFQAGAGTSDAALIVSHPEWGDGVIKTMSLALNGDLEIETYEGRLVNTTVSKLNLRDLMGTFEWLDLHEPKPFSRENICMMTAPKAYRKVEKLNLKTGTMGVIEENDRCTAEKGVGYESELADEALNGLIQDLVVIAQQSL